MLLLIANEVVPPGALAGWSSFGIAGLILAWLFFVHLPSKDKLFSSFIEKKDEQIDEQRKEFTIALTLRDNQSDAQQKEYTTTLREMMKEFRNESALERAACERHFGTLADTMRQSFDTIGKQLHTHSERNQQWIEMLKGEVEIRKKEVEAAKRGAPL